MISCAGDSSSIKPRDNVDTMMSCDWVNCADSLSNRYSSLFTPLYHDFWAGELEKPRIIYWVSGHREAKPPVRGRGIMVCSPLEPVHCCF